MTSTKIIVTTPQGIILKFIRNQTEADPKQLQSKDLFYIKDGFLYLTDDKGVPKGFPIAWCELTGVQ